MIASADHGHAHSADGPYGFDGPQRSSTSVSSTSSAGDLARLLELDLDLVRRAAADSYWQLLMLHGALGDGWQAELLSYEAPTYYGMLCARSPRADPEERSDSVRDPG